MVALLSFVALLLSVQSSLVAGAPVTAPMSEERSVASNVSKPSTTIDPTKGVSTPFGTATGVVSSDGSVVKFAVRYATAARWAAPVLATSWSSPANQTPLACPQNGMDASEYSEDCLYMILYVPVKAVMSGTAVNTLVWIHGGSFYEGAATDAGLDGSALALASGSIVATIQYRLGVLGWLPPSTMSSGINLGVKDATTALTFLNKLLSSFGGTANKITVAGQSSGALLIRGLLAAPTAASQFTNAILHSDPMDYNFLPKTAFTALQSSFYGSLSCSSTATSCLTALSVSSLLSAQSTLLNNAATISPAAGAAEPLRPTVDGSFITTSLTGNSFPSTLKPLILTTVKDDAAPTIAYNFPANFPASYYEPAIDASYGDSRTAAIVASQWYSPNMMSAMSPANDQVRAELNLLGTDSNWRCPTWSFARSYVAKGGSVHVGKFVQGATYAGNDQYDMCLEPGTVCHEDDIYITFGTTPSPTTVQTSLTKEIQARWSAFMHTSNPNPTSGGYPTWNPSTSSDVHALLLGNGGGEDDPGACTPSFWGSQVQYDWQIYGVN